MKTFSILIAPFLLWIFCFRYFFSGHIDLQADAVSYAEHIGFYTDHLAHGIYPLWDPAWYSGAPYDFFLRRIGDVNPLLWAVVLLKWFGVSSATSYLIFLGVYYFLAGWAIYLIVRSLLGDRLFAYMAYVLFLFSSWGSEVFYNYIIIIFVPIIWFFYFLLCFISSTQKKYFLGMCFCAGIIFTTYIPFFFLTILVIFAFLGILFYGKESFDFLKRSSSFFCKNKVFTGFCLVFLLSSCVPGLMFYKESKGGEFVLPNRHSGADIDSAVAVGLKNVNSGDIISHGYFDRIFDDQTDLDMGDIYIPYLFFLLLLCTVFARVNKLIFFLLFNVLFVSSITVTSASGVHRFLFDHILFFKFIRNIYYFFWLGILPMSILLAVGAFKSLLTAIDSSSHKRSWLAYVIFCHLVFALFLYTRHGVLWGAWVAILISFSYFLIYFFTDNKVSYKAGFVLFLLGVFIQSAQVYGALENNLLKNQRTQARIGQINQDANAKLSLYYASHWFSILVNYIDPQVLEGYRKHQFIFYDNVVPFTDSPQFFKTMQAIMSKKANISFLSRFDSRPGDWRSNRNAGFYADFDPVSAGELSLIANGANTLKLSAHLPQSRFLVINDNYNSDWHAFINGRETRLFRANYSFKGLWVPSGDSSIVLRFSSPSRYIFQWGLMIIFAGTFLYLLMLFRTERI